MSILVVGSVAYDDLETPAGRRSRILGGTATNFSAAASFFTKVHVVGVVGSDFDSEHIKFLESRGIDVTGLKIATGSTFRWQANYLKDMNNAETLKTELGVFAEFDPTLSDHHRQRPFLFLASIHPDLQLKVLDQMKGTRLVAVDTTKLWIDSTRDKLQKVIERASLVFANDSEARQLTGESNVIRAAKKIMTWGPRYVVVKRGEYGAMLFTANDIFAAPAFPVHDVVDPTGAGDTFAGGFLGYVAKCGEMTEAVLKRAIVCGTVMASFQVEDFGLQRIRVLERADIEGRISSFRQFSQFEYSPVF